MTQALIRPEMLVWARSRSRISPEIIARKLHVHPEQIVDWESGKAFPTFNQARSLAGAFHIPFGYLFLTTEPHERLPIADLRRTRKPRADSPSPEFRDVLYSALRKQDWYREELRDQGEEALSFVGMCTTDTPPENAAAELSRTLGITAQTARTIPTWSGYLSFIAEQSENAGILVLRNGIVGSNTHRSLDVGEFQGFALSDPIAPLVFVNVNDFETAKIFTLIHELAHIWAGASGVSDTGEADLLQDGDPEIERWCDRVAVETLCPREDFSSAWDVGVDLDTLTSRIARQYKVSSILVLRRALELGFIHKPLFFAQYDKELARQKRPDNAEKGSGGPPPAVIIPYRNGKRYTRHVLDSVMGEHISWRDAATLLDTSVGVVEGLAGGKTTR
ncbi:MAG: hypothetical protein A2413_19085 [Treponema sp. RIFOXYC1_FULL_61_9]|nr:MAG: hypothetical protein A2Y36_15860 [Treponema sp. GWA1_62_8]OHE74608.1 MAG: hypothetical protein A2413_19085 [Treponema sp. RIFOXYC1_FULL_61_9]